MSILKRRQNKIKALVGLAEWRISQNFRRATFMVRPFPLKPTPQASESFEASVERARKVPPTLSQGL